MRNINLPDIAFIILSCIVFIAFDYLGYSEIISRFSYLILIIGYFIGKLISRHYQPKKKVSQKGEDLVESVRTRQPNTSDEAI